MNDARRGNAETDASIQITSHDTAIAVETPALGWQSALERPPRIRTAELAWRAAAPGVVSFPLVAGALNTVGFVFPEARGLVETGDQDAARQALEKMALAKPARPATAANTGNAERRTTRIKPPGDLLKLEDRLYYLLQPPIEALLIDGELTFPFEPFHYQMDGIAFLYPRSHAIIADEMGLGKTMQTISAMRLLVHRGELRRILLICPKPLVSNWQREFALWAPEIPLNVVGGTQQRRHFQWRQPEALVTIANYELLLRDEAVVTDPALHYDLVALDEAQRIKNSRNSTAQVVRKIARTRSWALTGTPIENSPDDLVGIFEFLSPGYLRPGMKPKQLRRAVADHVLRRTKDAVLTDLPPKLYRDAHVDLTAEQRETYARAEDEGVVQLNDLGEGLTVQHVFELVLRLKQICNFDPATGASAKM
ncbi:MAG: DEAD/DEAH box helicase family protein, partial [Planctomycetales bacterium]|nr:DEAD/DEAH box helicase family protein [Planctomycetales bacterium]